MTDEFKQPGVSSATAGGEEKGCPSTQRNSSVQRGEQRELGNFGVGAPAEVFVPVAREGRAAPWCGMGHFLSRGRKKEAISYGYCRHKALVQQEQGMARGNLSGHQVSLRWKSVRSASSALVCSPHPTSPPPPPLFIFSHFFSFFLSFFLFCLYLFLLFNFFFSPRVSGKLLPGQRRSGSSICSEELENGHRPNHISMAGRGWQWARGETAGSAERSDPSKAHGRLSGARGTAFPRRPSAFRLCVTKKVREHRGRN